MKKKGFLLIISFCFLYVFILSSFFSNVGAINGLNLKNGVNSFNKMKYITTMDKTYNLDSSYYPYYAMLNDEEKLLYKQMYMEANNLSSKFKSVVQLDSKSVNKVFEALYNEHPGLFWLENTYLCENNYKGECIAISLNYNDTSKDIEYHKKLFNEEAKKIIDGASKYERDYDKIKYVHDSIIEKVRYEEGASMHQSAYSALVNGESICAGYTRAFQYILMQLEIPSYYCVGKSGENHAWNIIKLGENYYNVDITWDDNRYSRYKYFMISDKKISETHVRVGSSKNLPKSLTSVL